MQEHGIGKKELEVIHASQVIFDDKKTLPEIIKELRDLIEERSETSEENT